MIDKRRILCCNDGFPGNRVSVAPSDLVSRKDFGKNPLSNSIWDITMEFYYVLLSSGYEAAFPSYGYA